MYQLNKATVTGVNEHVDFVRLVEITHKFPFVEWGVLSSGDRKANENWIRELPQKINSLKVNIPFSLHLCGKHTQTLLNEGRWLVDPSSAFRRIQLNLKQDQEFNPDLLNESDFNTPALLKKPYIVQIGRNANGWHLFRKIADKIKNTQILFDASGGRGIVSKLTHYDLPIRRTYIGFAGGFNAENVVDKIQEIKDLFPENQSGKFWIDVESGVHSDDNILDLDKVEKYLEIVSDFVEFNNEQNDN